MNSQQELLDAINTITQSKDRSCDTPATVLRVEGDTVWVHIDGGADETPVQKTINCSEGETVQVRISNGSAFLVGNASAPPTDDTTANVAHFVAEQADVKATEAIRTANAIVQTVQGKVDSGDSNITDLSSTIYQDAYGVNIFNDTLAVGDNYAHIDGDSFDIKECTTAGSIDNVNDAVVASFGQVVTVGSRRTGTIGPNSRVFGWNCVASHNMAHAEGSWTTASGMISHAEGSQTTASGENSHAEGDKAEASGLCAHSEGFWSEASGAYSHAEGWETTASNDCAHAEGSDTTASGGESHAEGSNTVASGPSSHAEGEGTIASGPYAHSQNYHTIASSDAQTAIGQYNISDDVNTYALIIGNGTADNARSDALRVKWNGDVLTSGEVQTLNGDRKYVAEPSSEGTNGQVLTTDGSGGRSWTTVGGGTSPTILTSTTISASTTSYTFSDASITTDSVIDIYDSIFGFAPTGMTVSNGSCTITFPAQSSTHTIKLFVY